jgi:hypothetical protein
MASPLYSAADRGAVSRQSYYREYRTSGEMSTMNEYIYSYSFGESPKWIRTKSSQSNSQCMMSHVYYLMVS